MRIDTKDIRPSLVADIVIDWEADEELSPKYRKMADSLKAFLQKTQGENHTKCLLKEAFSREFPTFPNPYENKPSKTRPGV